MKNIFLLFLCFLSFTFFAQSNKVTTSVNVTKNKIGAEFKFILKTETDIHSKVKFPEAKNFGALEVIQSYRVDSIKKGSRLELIKKYGLTQFDSGKYVIPKLPVIINGKTIFSDSLKVEVNDVKVDTLKQKMYDIKDIALVKSPIGNWWIYLLILLALLVVSYFIFRYIQKRKKPVTKEEEVYKTPIEKATSLLQMLEKKELWQKGEIKNYYSELTDIARIYIEEEINVPAMESTTSELIEGLRKAAKQKKLKLSNETVENLEKVLKQADLVKFAKVKPLDFEIEEDKKRISNAIVVIHKSIPEIVASNDELELWNEQQKELARLEKLKKEKRQRTIKIVSAFVFILVGLLTYFIITKGFENVRDSIFGSPTKDLVEGEWIYSQYGNPGVKIETPKVLKRTDASTYLPKDTMALLKEMQLFIYGSMLDDFYLAVSTSTFKQETKIDLEQTADNCIKIFESKGAKNIVTKTDDFDTQKGITGKKVYGTMTFIDKSKSRSTKMFYEVLLFSQNNGIQQITIMHKEEDKYGQKIAERVLNSVELKVAE